MDACMDRSVHGQASGQTGRHVGRQTHGRADRQAGGQIDRQVGRQTAHLVDDEADGRHEEPRDGGVAAVRVAAHRGGVRLQRCV